jgi:hypothetical protein
LLWRDNFAEHLLINRSHKPDMPTKVSCLLLPSQALLISRRALLVGAVLLIGSPWSKYTRSEYFILRQTHNFQDLNNLQACQNIQGLNNLFCVERIILKIRIICGISFNNFASSFWSLNLKMADDDSFRTRQDSQRGVPGNI